MKHTVTLDESDLRQAVRKYVEEEFPGYTASRFNFRMTHAGNQLEPMQATVEVDLGRPATPKD